MELTKFANLHLHSTYSDGSFTPSQLVVIAKSLGYKALAVTDHEAIAGYAELKEAAEREGMYALSGVELGGADNRGRNFHIVGLDFDPESPVMQCFIEERQAIYAEYSRKCFERGLRLGYFEGVTWNDVLDSCDAGAWVCVDHIFRLFRQKGIVTPGGDGEELRAKMYREPEARSYSPTFPVAEEVIDVIRRSGGIAVLAHPYKKLPYVAELVEAGLKGIEVCHPDLDADSEHPALSLAAAKEFGLYRSGGTDHSGPLSGCGGTWAYPAFHGAEEEDFFEIKERRRG